LNQKAHRPPTLFSYVVDHDNGFAPNPANGYCTLVHCKFGGLRGPKNIVELAEVGDWVIGTGGSSKHSAGHGRIIYLMRVDEKLPFGEFLNDRRFRGRWDCQDLGSNNAFALVSKHYFYLGSNALNLEALPYELAANLAKKGPGFRRDYPTEKIPLLARWFGRKLNVGVLGEPCGDSDMKNAFRLDDMRKADSRCC